MDSATQQRIRTLINFIRNTQEPGSIANDMVGEILSVLQDNDSDIATSANNVNSRISSLAQKYESVNYYGDLSEQTLADGGLTFRVWTQTNPPAGVSDWRIYLATLKAVTEDGETEWVISDNGLYKRFVYCFVNPSNPKQICAVPPGTTWEAFTAEVGGTEHSFKGNESYGTMASGVTHPGVVPHAGKIYYNCTTRRCVVFGGDADVRRLADLLSLAEMRAEMNAVAAPIRADLNALGENVENFAPVFEELQTDVEGLSTKVEGISSEHVVYALNGIVEDTSEMTSDGYYYVNFNDSNRGLWEYKHDHPTKMTLAKPAVAICNDAVYCISETRIARLRGMTASKDWDGQKLILKLQDDVTGEVYTWELPDYGYMQDLPELLARMATAEGNIETNTGNITELTDAIGGKASASDVSALADRVTAAEGDIASKASADSLLRLGIYPFNGIVERVGNLPDTNGIYYVNQEQLFYSVSDSGASKGVYMNDRYNGNPTTPSVNKTATYSLYGSLYMIESDGVMYKVVDNYAISSLYQTLSSDISKKASASVVSALADLVDSQQETIVDTKAAADTLVRDFAQYDSQVAIPLAVGESNKAVSIAGQVVDKANYQTSELVRLKKGCTYLFAPSDGEDIDAGVALCARYTAEDVTVMIDYVFTYDEQGRIATATADYDSSLVYAYAYAEDAEEPTITDAEGNEVESLPQTRVITRGSYVPMFKSLGGGRPRSGYYAVLANDDATAVWSAPDIGNCELIEVSYGVIRSLVNQKEDKAVVKRLEERVDKIAAESDLTDYEKLGWDYTDAMWWMSRAESADYFKQGVKYGAELYDSRRGVTWFGTLFKDDTSLVYAPDIFQRDSIQNFNACFYGCSNLVYLPPIVAPNANNAGTLLEGCTSLEYVPRIELKNFSAGLFSGCTSLKKIGVLKAESVNIGRIFYNCSSLKVAPDISDAVSLGEYAFTFTNCTSLERVEGFPIGHITSMTGACLSNWKALPNIKYMFLKGLGMPESATTFYLSIYSGWGKDSDENRQSLVDTLLTHSCDRVAQGWDAVTVKIHADNLALLTEDELAQIAAKGITLTT